MKKPKITSEEHARNTIRAKAELLKKDPRQTANQKRELRALLDASYRTEKRKGEKAFKAAEQLLKLLRKRKVQFVAAEEKAISPVKNEIRKRKGGADRAAKAKAERSVEEAKPKADVAKEAAVQKLHIEKLRRGMHGKITGALKQFDTLKWRSSAQLKKILTGWAGDYFHSLSKKDALLLKGYSEESQATTNTGGINWSVRVGQNKFTVKTETFLIPPGRKYRKVRHGNEKLFPTSIATGKEL